MLNINLLQDFYSQAGESDLETEENKNSFDYQEYIKHMINLRQAIRFFLDWEQRNS